MYHRCFTHSATDGHLGCFQILTIVNNASMNIGVLMFFQMSVLGFFAYIPRSGILGHKGVPFLIFWGNSILLSTLAAPVCSPYFLHAQSFFTKKFSWTQIVKGGLKHLTTGLWTSATHIPQTKPIRLFWELEMGFWGTGQEDSSRHFEQRGHIEVMQSQVGRP